VKIRYSALVENNLRQLLPQTGLQHVWSELPSDVLPFLLPSRFCPSDKFMRFAQREFSSAGDGVARVMAILDWIHRNVDYVAGVSDAETTAEGTFVDRAGVCLDFTHLGITLSRALVIPARAVSAYALELDPPDFHAIFEVYIANGWWLIDPTRLAPIEGIVRIGSGRDASDIAFLTTDKQCEVMRQRFRFRGRLKHAACPVELLLIVLARRAHIRSRRIRLDARLFRLPYLRPECGARFYHPWTLKL
jgi:transglutaminase-like putative cysteine protease